MPHTRAAVGVDALVRRANGVVGALCEKGDGKAELRLATSMGIGRARVSVEMVGAKVRGGDWKGVPEMVGNPNET
jgi:hypothetical protein